MNEGEKNTSGGGGGGVELCWIFLKIFSKLKQIREHKKIIRKRKKKKENDTSIYPSSPHNLELRPIPSH